MFSQALFFAVVTGLTWTAIGIVLSRCARNDFDVVSYSLLQTGFAGILCFIFYADLSRSGSSHGLLLLAIIILSAAMLNALAQYLVQTAMRKGGAAVVWAIAQAAMVIPFCAGVILFGSRITFWNLAGLILIIGGVFFPTVRHFQCVRNWFLPAFAALVIYGTLQTLYLIPSHLTTVTDTASLRPFLVCVGNFTAWSLIGSIRKERLTFSRLTWIAAITMAAIHTSGVKTFFITLDTLSRIGKGSLGMPLMQGINLAAFGIYALICLKEKRNAAEVTGVLLILTGILLLR